MLYTVRTHAQVKALLNLGASIASCLNQPFWIALCIRTVADCELLRSQQRSLTTFHAGRPSLMPSSLPSTSTTRCATPHRPTSLSDVRRCARWLLESYLHGPRTAGALPITQLVQFYWCSSSRAFMINAKQLVRERVKQQVADSFRRSCTPAVLRYMHLYVMYVYIYIYVYIYLHTDVHIHLYKYANSP